MRRIAPLALGLLLSPLLAHADALDSVALVLEMIAALWGFALLALLFSLLAYLHPASRSRQLTNYVLVGLSILLGLGWLRLFGRSAGGGGLNFWAFNPFLTLVIPCAAWLGGANKAAHATRPSARRWGVALAVVGAQLLASTVLSVAMRWLLPYFWGRRAGEGYSPGQWVLSLLVSVGIWWLVLGQAQRRQPLGWQQLPIIVGVSALATILSALYGYLPILPYLGELDAQWLGQAAQSFFTYGLVSCAVGALAIWLQQRRYRPVLLP